MKSSVLALAVLAFAVNVHAADKPLPVGQVLAFPNLRIYRPIEVKHAGDGSNRLFVAQQDGVIHVFPNRPNVSKTKVFLNIKSRVVYKDRENEEGLLGMTFHPKFKQNGQFFLYYTTSSAPHTSVISRFRVSKTDPNKADPSSEEEIMRIKQPFWNHNGGTILFGPDGYLYIALGDGGKARDPLGAGQNLSMLLGSILRIDVDHRDPGKKYSIPKDNPFIKRRKARPEIYAYGVRNIWRMSFDRKTGVLWAADVGQDIWEEINIIVKGGNYGWNLREAKHKFGPNGSGPRRDLIDPIWEYDHKVGKSITGGVVYRGSSVPLLKGKYVYADYVTGKIWALHYDMKAKKVIANYRLRSNGLPIITFGEDQQGEVYFTTTLSGGRIYKFKQLKK